MDLVIRPETQADHAIVEDLTREAFWNLFVPGCNEHYLAHIMRSHADFVPDLDLVAQLDDAIVGNIMFTRSALVNDAGDRLETLTFGPVSVLPAHQGRGIGAALIREAIRRIPRDTYKAVIIYGHPRNYCKHGFRSGRDCGVSTPDGKYPYSMLVLELESGILAGRRWRFLESSVFQSLDPQAAEAFDATFPPKEKAYRPSQEEFSIASRAYLE
jgi:predicted N-acetyltransferase YhbS